MLQLLNERRTVDADFTLRDREIGQRGPGMARFVVVVVVVVVVVLFCFVLFCFFPFVLVTNCVESQS